MGTPRPGARTSGKHSSRKRFSPDLALAVLFSAYALVVAIYLIRQNRPPQSTFAWLFLLLVLPVGGLVIYVMFGRNRHAFSRRRDLTPLSEGTTLASRAAAVVAGQPERLAALAETHGVYARLAAMLRAHR